jgi:hypothetical protein
MLRVLAAAAALAGLLCAAPALGTAQVVSLTDYCTASAADHADCIQKWLNQAATRGADLYVPPGEWRHSRAVYMHSGSHIRCASPGASVFKNIKNAGGLFRANPKPKELRNVIIENCGFDANGSTAKYLEMIGANRPAVSNIHIRGNRFYDSAAPGKTSAQQRQYIVLVPCVDCWIENNRLSEGGRIKVGRPGQRLFVRGNHVEDTNDNAITVVDVGDGTSSEIVIEANVIQRPLGVGVFFGADGQTQTLPGLHTFNVQIAGNIVRGDWGTSCIQATLPAAAARVHIVRNICVKTGTAGKFPVGIGVTRTNDATAPAQELLIGFNSVGAEGGGVLYDGGIFMSGAHRGVRMLGNDVRQAGSPAIQLKNMDMTEALIADNLMAGGGLSIRGSFQGEVRDNRVSDAPGAGFLFATGAGQTIRASVAHNAIAGAKTCMQFEGPGPLEIDVADNALRGCIDRPLTFFSDLSAGSIRLHNKGDAQPHAAPTRHLTAVAPWNVALPAGATQGLAIPVSGARPGDVVNAGYDAAVADSIQVKAYVPANNTVRVLVTNGGGAAANLSGTVRVQVWRFD